MNTPTPETDAAVQRFILRPVTNSEANFIEFTRKLERERDEARLKAADRNEWQDVAMKVSAERDQLRKVCDEFYYADSQKEIAIARASFHQLPHVKEKTK